jgi:hypothetical protein
LFFGLLIFFTYSALPLTLPEGVELLLLPPHPAASVRSMTATAKRAKNFCFMIFFPPCFCFCGFVVFG